MTKGVEVKIDYKSILDANGIEYSTRQHSAGNIGINCPFCARSSDPDPSHHLGINLDTGAWNCWRNSAHRGGKPHHLLKALCGMSFDDVDRLLGVRAAAPTSEFDAMFGHGNDPFAEQPESSEESALSASAAADYNCFVRITSALAGPHRNYLRERGIHEYAMQEFGLMAGITGDWVGRVIFPVCAPDGGSVVTWTARAIGNATPKYRALGRAHGANIKSLLYNAERIQRGGETAVVTEGPMDAVVLQQLAPNTAVTCTFGLSVSDGQIALLKAADFSRIMFLFDSTAYGNAEACAARAGGDAIDFETLFNVTGDPGNLTSADIPALRAAGIT